MQPRGSPARGDVVVFLNSDTIVPSGWLDELLAPFDMGDVGAVGPRSDNVSGWRARRWRFPILREDPARLHGIRRVLAYEPPGADLRGGAAHRILSRRAYLSRSGLSEALTSGSRSADSRMTTCVDGCTRASFDY